MADMLCTIAQVKARLFPAGTTDTGDDAMLTEIVEEVSAWIQGYTGRQFLPDAAATYVFDTHAGYVLQVPRGIRTITSMGVALTAQPDSGGTYTTVPTSDQLLRPKAVDLADGWPFTEVRLSRAVPLTGMIAAFRTVENGCTITGDFGFAATPTDIQAVAIDASVTAYQNRKNGASGVIGSEDAAIVPWRYFFGKGSSQRMTLDRYRAWAV